MASRLSGTLRVGVISDTHGLLRQEAVAALRGAALILHAGDVGAAFVLDELRRIAPVVAVRGNNDRDAWGRTLPERVTLELEGVSLLMLHDVKELGEAAGARVVVAGHSHAPRCQREGGVLWFNPGSAGPRRFRLPVTVGWLTFAAGRVRGRVVSLSRGR